MSRDIVAFTLLVSLSVALANGQDAKKPAKDPPAAVSTDEDKNLKPPKLLSPKDSAAERRLRPAAPEKRRLIEKGYAAGTPAEVAAERRAKAAKNYLATLGIEDSRMTTVSYGKELPIDPGHNESAWARNRRAHFLAVAK